MDFSFLGGSMGSAVGGEARPCLRRRCGATGAAHLRYGVGGRACRKGILSLAAAEKTMCAPSRTLHEGGQVLISVMAHPTTAGVLAASRRWAT